MKKKILFCLFLLPFVVGLSLGVLASNSYADDMALFWLDSTGTVKIEFLYKYSLTNFQWVDASTAGAEISYNPLVSKSVNIGISDPSKIFGMRFYHVFEGNWNRNFNLMYRFKSLVSGDSVFAPSRVKSVGMTWNRSDMVTDLVSPNPSTFRGISAYDSVIPLEDFTLLISAGGFPLQSKYEYGTSDSTVYNFVGYVELEHLSSGFSSSSFTVDLSYSWDTDIPDFISFDNFDEVVKGSIKNVFNELTQLNMAPVVNTMDFIDGAKITSGLGSSLSLCINPFLYIFFGNYNPTWHFIVTFSFGVFVILIVIGYVRRVHS